jgi:hypothetical protein
MMRLPLIPKEGLQNGPWRHTRRACLPVFYMNDFSRLGLRVRSCNAALSVLAANSYGVVQDEDGSHVTLDGAAQVQALVQLLNGHGIDCEIADVADQIYQG